MGVKLDDLPPEYQQQVREAGAKKKAAPPPKAGKKPKKKRVPPKCREKRNLPPPRFEVDGTTLTIWVTMMGKPRMTQQDKWLSPPRERVASYRELDDQIKAVAPPELLEGIIGLSWICYLPMAKSWSKKKKAAHQGQLHQAKPDRDNIDKAICDILLKEDSVVAYGFIEKRWDDGAEPRIILKFHYADDG